MTDAASANADQQAFWNGVGGRIWVERQAHTDATLEPVTAALLACAAPRPGESVLDIGCGCGASTLEVARAVGTGGSVVALDISDPMLNEARKRADRAGIRNIHWRHSDAATAQLDPFDLLISNFGLMFFGDPLAAFSHLRRSARRGARMAFTCWRPLDENPWIGVPMDAAAAHLPPRSKGNSDGPGMFAFAQPDRVTTILTEAGWRAPHFEKFDCQLDIAASRGLGEAVAQSTRIGAVNSWLRGQPDQIVNAATASIEAALAPYCNGDRVHLPGAVWLVSSVAA